MKISVKKRYVLILLVASAQAVCLCVGVLAFDKWLRESMRTSIHDQVVADNVHTAKQMSTLIREMDVSDLRSDAAAWRRIQSVVHDIQLPNDGFVCIVDAVDGQLLCHPDLGAVEEDVVNGMVKPGMVKPGMVKPGMVKPEMVKPEMVKPGMVKPGMVKPGMVKPGMVKPEMVKPGMVKPGMVKPEMVAGVREASEVTGSVREYLGEVQIIAAAYLPDLNAYVNVHQKAAGIERRIEILLNPVLQIGLAISVLLVIGTTILVLAILHTYENRLAKINESLEDLVEKRTRSLRNVRDSVVFGLAKLAESRDTDTGEHLERIHMYVSVLAFQLAKTRPEFDTIYIENLALASSLHDIGKVGIPDSVLLKPGAFAASEREIMETHANLGGECLDAIGERLGQDDFLQLSREIAFGHHERWDGTGYPNQIVGESIPLSARIVALADVYDALRSRRPYKEPMSHDKARSIILKDRGTHFDPEIVDAFLNCERSFMEISEQYNVLPEKESTPVGMTLSDEEFETVTSTFGQSQLVQV